MKLQTTMSRRSSGSQAIAGLWRLGAYLFCVSVSHAQTDLPVELEVSVEQSTLMIGEPLVIDMRVTNTGADTLERLAIGSSDFWLIWFQNDTLEGCDFPDLGVSLALQHPPFMRETFAFHWDVSELEPGQSRSCRITYPQTLLPGRETIELTGSARVDGEFISQPLAEFTYSLLPENGIPVLVEIAMEHPIVMAGEPLAIDFRITNLGTEVLDPLSVLSSEFTLTGHEAHMLEGCTPGVSLEIFPAGSAFALALRVPGLQPGEAVVCRAMFPQTLHPGDEQIRLDVLLDNVLWEDEAGFAYRVRPFADAPFSIDVRPRHSDVLVAEPLEFEFRVINTSQEALSDLLLISEAFMAVNFSSATTEGCEFSEDLRREFQLFGWPLWERDNLEPGVRLVWQVPELSPGETVRCHITMPNTWQTGEDTLRLSAWREGTPWRDLGEFSYAVVSELPPPVPVPVNSRVWLILAALMLLLMGGWRLRLP